MCFIGPALFKTKLSSFQGTNLNIKYVYVRNDVADVHSRRCGRTLAKSGCDWSAPPVCSGVLHLQAPECSDCVAGVVWLHFHYSQSGRQNLAYRNAVNVQNVPVLFIPNYH